MNKDRRPWQGEDVDYWRSMVDIIIGLLLVILLAMALMVMGLLDQKKGEGDYTEIEPTPTVTVTPTPSPTPVPTPAPTPVQDAGIGGGGGGGGEGGLWNTPVPSPTPRQYEFDKSAVRVMVYDSDSGDLLTIASASFNLTKDGTKQKLYVRYPEVKGYTVFSTQNKGSFYLPEKLMPGEYVLETAQLLEAFDLPDSVSFTLEQDHDWDDPYIVTIEAMPSKNLIRLEMVDAETGDAVWGGSCDVVAAADILSGDGSILYSEGDVADTIHCSNAESAVSAELHLGNYRVIVNSPAFGYADTGEAVDVVLKKRQSSAASETVQIKVSRTKVVVTARDGAGYTRLQGVKFTVTGQNGATECVTDENGEITLVNLEKNTEYTITQSEAFEDYQSDREPIVFTVDSKGLIDGKSVLSVEQLENRIVCRFDLTGTILPRSISGTMTLRDAEGRVVEQWSTGGGAVTVTSIEPGTYTLETEQAQTMITVLNTSVTQAFVLHQWSLADTAVVAGAVLLLAGIVVLIIRRRRKKN